MNINIQPHHSALVIIDLQKGIVSRPSAPHDTKDVIVRISRIIDACRKNKISIFPVHVTSSVDERDRLTPFSDEPVMIPQELPDDWSEIIPELSIMPTDIVITKRQWGAFYGTELDLQLRRRGIDTMILCGISTNIGVESTARDAFERGYQQIFVEDAMSARTSQEHLHTIKYIFPRIGQVRSTEQIIQAIQE